MEFPGAKETDEEQTGAGWFHGRTQIAEPQYLSSTKHKSLKCS